MRRSNWRGLVAALLVVASTAVAGGETFEQRWMEMVESLFLRDTFDAGDTPFFRPPFGYHDDRVDSIAAGEGHPTIAMWNGTLGDDRIITGQEIVGFARQWFAAQSIVIGHANHPAVTEVYGQLLDLIAQLGLRTVTLSDVWATRASRLAGMAGSTSAPVR